MPISARALRLALPGVGVIFLLFLLLPLLALFIGLTPAAVLGAFQPGAAATGSVRQPLLTSLEALGCTLVVVILGGTPLAHLLARSHFPRRQALELLLLIPFAMPPLVLGLLLVTVYGPYGIIGARLGPAALALVNSFWALCLAQIYEAAPAYVLAAAAAFAQVDRRYEQASWLLGCAPAATFRRVTLPLAAPGLAVALALAVVRALGAFGAVLVVAYHPVSLPLAVWLGLEERGLPQALPIAAILLLVTLPLPLGAALWGYRAQRRTDLSPPAI